MVVEELPDFDQEQMIIRIEDDSTIRFETVMVRVDVCKARVGALARLRRVTRYFSGKPTLSWRFKMDKPFLHPRLHVDADSVGWVDADELVTGRSRVLPVGLGMRC